MGFLMWPSRGEDFKPAHNLIEWEAEMSHASDAPR